jgi:hypothetical protein
MAESFARLSGAALVGVASTTQTRLSDSSEQDRLGSFAWPRHSATPDPYPPRRSTKPAGRLPPTETWPGQSPQLQQPAAVAAATQVLRQPRACRACLHSPQPTPGRQKSLPSSAASNFQHTSPALTACTEVRVRLSAVPAAQPLQSAPAPGSSYPAQTTVAYQWATPRCLCSRSSIATKAPSKQSAT